MTLATRNLMDSLRSAGAVTGGPKPFSPRDRSSFLAASRSGAGAAQARRVRVVFFFVIPERGLWPASSESITTVGFGWLPSPFYWIRGYGFRAPAFGRPRNDDVGTGCCTSGRPRNDAATNQSRRISFKLSPASFTILRLARCRALALNQTFATHFSSASARNGLHSGSIVGVFHAYRSLAFRLAPWRGAGDFVRHHVVGRNGASCHRR